MARSGPTPFGYKRMHGRLTPHPQEAPIRQLMFELFLQHRRKKTVADILNADGHRTRNGAMFSGPTIGRLISDDCAVGVPGQIDMLVSKEMFEKCQAILQAQKSGAATGRKPRHIFAGLTHCSCDGKMYVPSNSQKYTCRDCKSKILAADLEAVVLEQLYTKAPDTETGGHLKTLVAEWKNLDLTQKHTLLTAAVTRIDVDVKAGVITVTFAAL